MKRFPVTLFQSHYSIYIVGRSDFLSNSTGPVSPSEQPDRPGFRANFSRWGPGGLDLNLPPIRAVLKLPTTRPIRVSSGFDYLRTDQMFGPMPLLIKCSRFGVRVRFDKRFGGSAGGSLAAVEFSVRGWMESFNRSLFGRRGCRLFPLLLS